MKVLKSKRNSNTINLEIEMAQHDIESKMDVAFKKVSKNATVSGFRKGKIPRKIFEREFGKSSIIQEALYDAIDQTYKDAIKELNLKVVDYPKNVDVDEYKEAQPITYRCEVDVEPEVKLKKYKKLSIQFKEKVPTNEDLNKELDVLTDMYATYESTDKESKNEDIVRFNATVTDSEGNVFDLWSRENLATRIGKENYGKQVDIELTGLKKADKKKFTATYNADFHVKDVVGKTLSFDIDVLDVRQKSKADLNDELAKKIDKNCDTVDLLKEKLNKELTGRYEKENKQQKEQLIFDALIDENPFDVPLAMIDQEVDYSLMQFEYSLHQQGLNMDQYMKMTNKTKDDLKVDMREPSEKRVKLRKLMESIIEKEEIEVSDDELEKEVVSWNHESIKSIDDLKSSKSHDFNTLKNNLIDEKVRTFLISSAKIK